MNTPNPILGAALALAFLAWSPATGSAQMGHGGMMGQDTTRAGRMMPGQMAPGMMAACGRMMGMMGMMGAMGPGMMGMMGPGMMGQGMMGQGMQGMMGGGMMGQGMMGQGMMGAGMMVHGMQAGMYAPGFLLGLKSQLGLSDDQAKRLEGIQSGLRTAMQSQGQKLRDVHDSLIQARQKEDWSAVENGIDQAAKLQAGAAKAQVEAVKKTLAVLSPEQRQKLDSWRQGAMMFQQGMQGMLQHMGGGPGSGNQR